MLVAGGGAVSRRLNASVTAGSDYGCVNPRTRTRSSAAAPGRTAPTASARRRRAPRPGRRTRAPSSTSSAVGAAAEQQAVQRADPLAGSALDAATSGRAASCFACSMHERAVHQEQRLLRHGRREPLRAVRVGAGEVERAEHARQVLAVDEAVDRPPRSASGAGDVHRPAADGRGRAGRRRPAASRASPRSPAAGGSCCQSSRFSGSAAVHSGAVVAGLLVGRATAGSAGAAS